MQNPHGQQPYYSFDASLAPGFVTPTATHQKPWASSSSQSTAVGGSKTGVHRLPRLSLAKSSDSTDNKSTGTDVATLATEHTSGSVDEAEKLEATASALLMVSAGFKKEEPSVSAAASEEQPSSPAPHNSVPLKKRKKHSIASQEQPEQSEVCQVSPASHASIGGRAVSREELTPERPGRLEHPGAQRAPSYDSKQSPIPRSSKDATQELLNSSKVHNATDIHIAPPSQVVFPHFPTVLHRLLSDDEFSGSVVTWLEDGESWKVLRWDALRRNVLPLYFPDIADEQGKPSGTIDAFLWQLSAWGFQEITDGSDVGAYKHEVRAITPSILPSLCLGMILTFSSHSTYLQLFIRGAQKLCSKMRFTPAPEKNNSPKAVSPHRVNYHQNGSARSILRVPSLASATRPEDHSPFKRQKVANHPNPNGWPTRPMESFTINYPPPTDGSWPQYYTPESSNHGAMHSFHQPHDSRLFGYHSSGPPPVGRPGQYAAPQVRSSRGRSALASSTRKLSASPVAAASAIPAHPVSTKLNFPVSNRGKGPRKPAGAYRSPLVASSAEKSASKTTVDETAQNANSLEESAEATGERVAMAVSKKSKRKFCLPLARNSTIETGPVKKEEVAVKEEPTDV